MRDKPTFGLSELARLGFTDLSGASAKLEAFSEAVGELDAFVLKAISESADPDQSLSGLIEIAAMQPKETFRLLQSQDSAQRLCFIFGASTALKDFVVRHPVQLEAFRSEPNLLSAEGYTKEVLSLLRPVLVDGLTSQEAWNILRVTYRGWLLKIAIYDLTQPDVRVGLPEVAAALADIAEAALEAGLAIARAELRYSAEFGLFSPEELDATLLTVIAMGKCGARELNYISDVDVIFVADTASDLLSSQRAVEIATKLASRMMRAIDGTSSEPMLWQVDANLRPEGKSGALVRTLDSHVAYYERWAQSWEFQALLKARPVAGDMNLGRRYLDALSPKIWNSASRENFVESVQKMRLRVTEFIPADEIDIQIKLGPGGLRDIEFTVQLLQLVHGRTDSSVRQRDTLSAIEALSAGGYIGRAEATEFSSKYRFLRLLEHRIQMSDMRRTHLMPTSEPKLRALARAVNPRFTTQNLEAEWESTKLSVKTLHQKIFYRPLLSAVSKLADGGALLSEQQVGDRLRAIGFNDPKRAIDQIEALTSGLSRRAVIQRQLLPVLLEWFSEGTDPDSALVAFRRLSEDLGESHWYLKMLRDSSGAAERMTQVLSNSRLATSLFEKIPEAAAWFESSEDLVPISFESLTTEFEAVIARHENIDIAANSVRGIRRRETLRLAMGAVLGQTTMEQISLGLSDLTAAYIGAMLELASEICAAENDVSCVSEILDFGVIAMGRFGGEELGFGSDADVMFVYEAKSGVEGSDAQRVSERIVSELRRLSLDQVLEFDLDLDLRPEGKNGPVSRSLDSYANYYLRWADTWEAQALLRAKPILGSPGLRQNFLNLIAKYRYPVQLPEASAIEIRRIKARVENERLPLGADPKRHLKLGRGAISDVEWLVQLLQMQHGFAHPKIRTPRTLAALDAMVSEGLVEEHDARVLSGAWTLASRIRSASVLFANKRTDVLPTDRRQLEGLARILEYPRDSANQLEEDYLAFTRRARSVYERLFFAVKQDSVDD